MESFFKLQTILLFMKMKAKYIFLYLFLHLYMFLLWMNEYNKCIFIFVIKKFLIPSKCCNNSSFIYKQKYLISSIHTLVYNFKIQSLKIWWGNISKQIQDHMFYCNTCFQVNLFHYKADCSNSHCFCSKTPFGVLKGHFRPSNPSQISNQSWNSRPNNVKIVLKQIKVL